MMNDGLSWSEANQRYLMAALRVLRARMSQHSPCATKGQEPEDAARAALDEAAAAMPAPSALESLSATFGLSPFERDIVLLCAGVELDSSFAGDCAAAQGDPGRPYPTFSLALATLREPHWSALSPDAPLRHWRLIEMVPGNALTLSPLRIDERILHYLAGVQHLDERLVGLVEPLLAQGDLVPSHRILVDRIVTTWARSARGPALPAILLCGHESTAKWAVAGAACAALGLTPVEMRAEAIPGSAAEIAVLIRLLEREAALAGRALMLDCEELDTVDSNRLTSAKHLIERIRVPLIVASRERWRTHSRPLLSLDVHKPTSDEQRAVWRATLGPAAPGMNGHVDKLVAQFGLSAPSIEAATIEALDQPWNTEDADLTGHLTLLWDACRLQARPRLDNLAQRIEPAASWQDLVLPDPQKQSLREIAAHVRQRMTVYESWGFGRTGTRGLGISALFAGASGTGKTMAAEVLASELRLDLYRIDLSGVVSKYIGETEKNLRRVFDAAEEGGAILLFDEADALFGKRSEVKDSHDRYANIEISYLLQRMEAYHGLAILTTNLKSALDPAFLRRIRFVVQFPFPDAAQRAEIWRRIFPSQTPSEGLDMTKLAKLNVAGGNIRNIALNAAFLAADAAEPVRMAHLLHAARGEYTKLERPLTEAEIGGWL